MTFVEWCTRMAIKLLAMAAVIVACTGAGWLGLDSIIPTLMARHYALAAMYGVAVLAAFVGALPLGLAIERYALKALGWPTYSPKH
ncbi:hypothetical protein [Paraburkholderia tropica]|uniref:hypothetical protein n=1 Tax=Paraburkholderia tropica TaxID=92647 RepID=UPI003D267684